MRAAACLAILVVLAGCSQAKDATGSAGTPGDTLGVQGNEPLSGFVFDPAIQPIAGAKLSIPSIGVETLADDKGRYAFTGLPYDAVMTVISQADGYKPSSKSLQLIEGSAMHVNFTLERVPVKAATFKVDSFNGVINCNGVVKASGDRHAVPCGLVAQGAGVDNRIWEFAVEANLAGLVVEVVWESDTELARHLNLTIETMGYGDQDRIIYSGEGPTILRGQIGTYDATRYYSSGGMVRVTVDIGRNTADEEVDIGVGFAAQQGFEVFASKFYVAPPPPDYTIQNAG